MTRSRSSLAGPSKPDDLIRLLSEDDTWDVIHFSGHGSKSHAILMVGDDGAARPVSKEALTRFFGSVGEKTRLVVLNACYSVGQAEAVTEHVDCAIGMSDAISDRAATLFAASFYRALGFGKSVKEAIDQGRLSIDLEGVSEVDTPQLRCRAGVEPEDLYLLVPNAWPRVQSEWTKRAPPPPPLGPDQRWHVFLS